MNISDEFNEKKYLHVQNVLSESQCSELTEYLKKQVEFNGHYDEQCPRSKSLYDDPVFTNLLNQLLPDVEQIVGKKLYPTYSYARFYQPEDELKMHLDREACEISLTVTLGFEGDVWPIFIGTPTSESLCIDNPENLNVGEHVINPTRVKMDVGDALVYKGCEMYHWREKYKEGKYQAQVFLHYVDANGPHKDWKNDKKNPHTKASQKTQSSVSDDLTYWYYSDVLTSNECDMLVDVYSKVQGEKGDLGAPSDTTSYNEEVRNVTKIILPTYKGLGAILTAVGIDANNQRWNFDIKGSNQCEFLKYPSGNGRYKGHMDTFMVKNPELLPYTRKLTVLAFLNDNYTGGKFFLQVDTNKIYPPQNKGTVLVFPSFLIHGVEDVEEGERFSAVCWMIGPWFK